MKQLFQDLKTGKVRLYDVPAPSPRMGELVIQSINTVISKGTEQMLADFGRAGWIGKARQQPDKVKQVIRKALTDGPIQTLQSVLNKLGDPLPLGYCNAGRVTDVGAGVERFAVDDLVVSNGPHAEVVMVPENLCAKVPGGVKPEVAAFTVLGAIALNGIRLLEVDIGSRVAVLGLGLLGLLSVQILKAAGCKVIAFDYEPERVELARSYGAEAWSLAGEIDPVTSALGFSGGFGVDGVLITAATKSNEPMQNAARMCRKRGKVVLVGVVGLELSRDDFYQKEISFQVSCSYGPGRYDPNYERRGLDYPIGFVRWTEQRNFEAVLELMKEGSISVEKLITARFDIKDAESTYTNFLTDSKQLGILVDYPGGAVVRDRVVYHAGSKGALQPGAVSVGLIGVGSFAKAVLLPKLKGLGADIRAVATMSGASSAQAAETAGVSYNTTEYERILSDQSISAVVISTRHDTHARLVIEALNAGKHVFVEKPLGLSAEEVERVRETAAARPGQVLAVGFNRRFSPCAVRAKELLIGRSGPLSGVMVVNAGIVPSTSWVVDPAEGGGRIVGEGCHFIDLFRFLVGVPITKVQSTFDGARAGATIVLSFEDGSVGTVHYLASGHPHVPKERLELFFDGKVLQLDNFKKLRGFGFPRFTRFVSGGQDKGHASELSAFLNAVRGEKAYPHTLCDIVEVSRAAVAAEASA